MEINVINDKLIEVILEKDYFTKRGLNFMNISTNPTVLGDFVNNLVAKIEEETDVRVNQRGIAVEFMQLAENFKIRLSIIDDDEDDMPFDGEVTNKEAMEWLANRFANAQNNSDIPKKLNNNNYIDEGGNVEELKEIGDYIVYFNNLDELCKLCNILNQRDNKRHKIIKSSMVYKIDDLYALLLFVSHTRMTKVILEPLLDEFMLKYKMNLDLQSTLYHYIEHGKVIVKDDAVSKLSKL